MKLIFFVTTLVSLISSRIYAQDSVPTIDLSHDSARQVIIAQGTSEQYQGHPYSVIMPDGLTVFCVWSRKHGGLAGPMAKSTNGGLTWTRLDDRMPKGFEKHDNCPSIYRMVDMVGKEYLWVFSAQPLMPRIVSRDAGQTWLEEKPLGLACVMSFSTIISKNPGVQDGRYLGFYHREAYNDGTPKLSERHATDPAKGTTHLQLMLSETSDAGWNWSEPKVIAESEVYAYAEPCAFWSPDTQEIAVLIRENKGYGGINRRAMMMFSKDKGATWTKPVQSSWELTGHRHIGTYLPDGRLFFAFRDTALGSQHDPKSWQGKSYPGLVGWVGSYDDLKAARPGQYRVRLLYSYAGSDCGYPGVFVTKDGSIVALTYIKYDQGSNKQSVVSTRFKIGELDVLARSSSSTLLR